MDTPMAQLRNRVGGTQLDLARKMGVSRELISLAERGGPLGGKAIQKLFDAFPVDLGRLGLTEGDFIRGRKAA